MRYAPGSAGSISGVNFHSAQIGMRFDNGFVLEIVFALTATFVMIQSVLFCQMAKFSIKRRE